MNIISSTLPSSIYINYPKVVITQKLSLLEFLLMGGREDGSFRDEMY